MRVVFVLASSRLCGRLASVATSDFSDTQISLGRPEQSCYGRGAEKKHTISHVPQTCAGIAAVSFGFALPKETHQYSPEPW